ncbi:DUF485 domain-containing protein [Labilibacter sediminis]|nr:DUF485 domain-containing protein [Labilibacter sediminis]
MKHPPATKPGIDRASKKKSKLGILLFIVYSVVYAGFVTIGVANYELMGKIVLGGQNLAIVYGFGLIIFAIILGLIYNAICTGYENKMNKEDIQ